MKILESMSIVLVAAIVSVTATGCATYRTISEAKSGSPKVYSGTRLDINVVRHDDVAMSRFNADPPPHPLIDLPFSILLDTVIFPLTSSVAAYEFVFE